jgi:Zn-dependent protease with chaperone function/tellurite resistance protein
VKEKIFSSLILVFSMLFVPISAFFLSTFLTNSFDESIKEINPNFKVSLVCEIVNSDKNSDLFRQMGDACTEIGWVELMGTVGLWLTGLTLALVALIWVSSRVVGANRNLVAFIFPKLVTFSLLALSLSIVAQGVLAVFGLYELQKEIAGMWYPVATGSIGLGAAIVAFAIVGAAMKIRLKPTMTQRAVQVTPEEQPKLWHFVESIAQLAGAQAPKNILLGLEPTFYATAAEVTALSSNKTVQGETLYLSLPLMRLFDKDELRAVIGHELGHFKGDDVAYTMKFAPVYRALGSAIDNVETSGQVLSLPALALLGLLHKNFERCEKQVSRDREFRADEVGASVGGAKNLISALLKLTVFGGFWSDLRNKVITHVDMGRPVSNISSLYASAVSFDADHEKANEFARQYADSRIHHPTDSHPTLDQRRNNLKLGEEIYLEAKLCLPIESAADLLDGLNELEERLSVDEQKWLIALGLAVFEYTKPEGENPYVIARVVQAAAAHLVCADGQVLPSEISMAEQLGEQLVPNFSQLEFRESCSNPGTLPSKDALLELIEAVFDQESRNLLVKFLTAIAESDGDISQDETQFIESIQSIKK